MALRIPATGSALLTDPLPVLPRLPRRRAAVHAGRTRLRANDHHRDLAAGRGHVACHGLESVTGVGVSATQMGVAGDTAELVGARTLGSIPG